MVTVMLSLCAAVGDQDWLDATWRRILRVRCGGLPAAWSAHCASPAATLLSTGADRMRHPGSRVRDGQLRLV